MKIIELDKTERLEIMLREKHLVFLLPAILLLVHYGDAAFRFGNGVGRNENYNNMQQYRTNYYKASNSVGDQGLGTMSRSSEHKSDVPNNINENNKSSQSRGFSAWGIIAIVIGVILLGTGGYYAFVFYPYICKKERSYDMIELTNVL